MKNTFKKITSVILAMFILMSVSVTAFAINGSGEYVGGSLEASGIIAENYYYEDTGAEEPLWEYDEHTYRYTDENGTVWRWFSKQNWIISAEDSNWMYRVKEDGTIGVVNTPGGTYTSTLKKEIIVPSSLDGYNVTELFRIGDGVAEDTVSVIVPEGVTDIGDSCFRNVRTIKRVVLPSTIKSVEASAFQLTDNVEIYFCGTEEQWSNVIVWNPAMILGDNVFWAVTKYDWNVSDIKANGEERNNGVKAIHYNVDPDTLPPVEDLIEEEPVEPTIWDKIAQAFENFADSIVVFFEKVANWFASIFA